MYNKVYKTKVNRGSKGNNVMNRWQKIAWFNLAVITGTLILTGITIAILSAVAGMPKALCGLGFLGFFGFMGLSPLIFRNKGGQVEFDERDRLFNMRAVLGAYSLFWLIFTAACMVPWFIIGPSGSIPVNVLPMMLMAIAMILTLVHSVLILVQYGRKGKDGQ